MQLRRLDPLDATIYRTFRLRGLRDHPDAFTSSFEEEDRQPISKAAERLSRTSSTHIRGAFASDEVTNVPTGGLMGVFGFTREERLKNCHRATLIGLFAAPEFSGRGVGRALVKAVMHDARADGIALLVLTVTEGNARARALYAQAGFLTIGIEPDAIRVGGVSYGKEYMAFQITPASGVVAPALAPALMLPLAPAPHPSLFNRAPEHANP